MAASTLRFGPFGFVSGVPMTAAGLLLAGGGTAVTTAAWSTANVIGNISIALGVLLFLWGTTINRRHLWQPWWRGPPNPFRINAWSRPWDYEEGSDVGGICWRKAFAHVRVDLTNISEAPVEDVTARLMPDQPIFESRARCDFAECRIGLDAKLPDVTIRAQLKGGREIDIPPSQMKQFVFGPPHRLFCERLPAGATIEINLATVIPDESPYIVKQERTDPEYIDIALKWHVAGEYSIARGRYTLRSEE